MTFRPECHRAGLVVLVILGYLEDRLDAVLVYDRHSLPSDYCCNQVRVSVEIGEEQK